MSAARLHPFEITLQNTAFAVRDALSEIRVALDPLELNTEDHGTVELVLAEALNNIVEHAYASNATDKQIAMHCSYKEDGLHVEIIDQGAEMPGGIAPLGAPVTLDVAFEDLPEGGFGWFLIKDLAKDVSYTRQNGENRLNLRLDVGQAS